jgi:hypothetical protein
MNRLDEFEVAWGTSEKNPFTFPKINDIYVLSSKNIDFNDQMCVEAINERFTKYTKDLVSLYNDLQKDKCIASYEDGESMNVRARMNRILEIVYYAKNIAVGFRRVHEASDLSRDYRDNTDASIFRFRAIDIADNTPYQNLLLFVLNYMYESGYSRYNGDVYKPILTKDGHNTRAWEIVESISNVVYGCAQKEVNYDQFLNFTHRSDSSRAVTEYLTNCIDSQFSSIEKDRHVFSFRNGIYLAKDNIFIPYTSSVPDDVVSSKFFDVSFDTANAKTYDDIETPLFDSILDYQDIKEDAKYWVYVFMGRLLYDINELDGWQVIFFFQGQAGTGKSTIANVCKSFYSDEDVGIMSNNIQRKFGLAEIVDKKIFIAPEIKRDFCLEQAEFQSMVSGDTMSVAEKYKKSRFVTWNVPGVLAGNETPDFIDNYGSIQRRIVSIRFTKKVSNGDMMLGKKLHAEIGKIMHKCNLAYKDAYTKYAKDDIWKHLPMYFVDNRNAMAAATNPLIHFLSSGKLKLGEGTMPEREFIQQFNVHCMDNNYSKPRFNPDFYTGPFTQFNITIKKNHQFYWPPPGTPGSKKMTGTAFVGVDVIHTVFGDDEEFSDED